MTCQFRRDGARGADQLLALVVRRPGRRHTLAISPSDSGSASTRSWITASSKACPRHVFIADDPACVDGVDRRPGTNAEPVDGPAGLSAVPQRRPCHRLLGHHLDGFRAVVVAVDAEEDERPVLQPKFMDDSLEIRLGPSVVLVRILPLELRDQGGAIALLEQLAGDGVLGRDVIAPTSDEPKLKMTTVAGRSYPMQDRCSRPFLVRKKTCTIGVEAPTRRMLSGTVA